MSIESRPLCGLLLLCCADDLPARVYLCVDAAGHRTYQQVRCNGHDPGSVELPHLNSLGDPLRPGERQLLEQLQRKSPERRRAPNTESDAPRSAVGQGGGDGTRCWHKSQQLDRVNRRLRRGYKAAQGVRLRERRRELEGYLRRFCR